MEAIETAGERKAKLEQDLAQASAAYRERAAALDQVARKAAAEKLAKKVETRAGFAGAGERGVSDRSSARRTGPSNGADRVEFLDFGECGRRAPGAG